MRRKVLLLALFVFILNACGGNEWLEEHNVRRCMHGVPELEWSSVLAEVATWRTINCSTCDHCKCEGSSCDPIYAQEYAENGICYPAKPKEAVDAWYSEIANYDYSNPIFSNNTGHFINIVVNTATKVGCACNESRCYCDYNSNFGVTPPELTQVVPKPVKAKAECVGSAP